MTQGPERYAYVINVKNVKRVIPGAGFLRLLRFLRRRTFDREPSPSLQPVAGRVGQPSLRGATHQRTKVGCAEPPYTYPGMAGNSTGQ